MKNEVNRALVAKKKLTILFAALTLSVGLWAETQTVSYRYPVYIDNDATKGIQEWKTEYVEATVVENSTWQVTWNAGWYVVTGEDVQFGRGATCNGAVNLILADGAKLEVTEEQSAGIQVSGEGNSLTIYGQANQSGQLIVNGGKNGAGIGGGGLEGSGSNITINGGIVTATGGENSAGIGGSGQNSGSKNITINGGIVTATGGKGGGAGIGGGNGKDGNGYGSNITINGGTVTATATREGAGIGGAGDKGAGSNITINGGIVTATGGDTGGAGIGGGYKGNGSNITITGGDVTATGGKPYVNTFGAGIGNGASLETAASDIKVATTHIVKAGDTENPTEEIATDRTGDNDIANDLAGQQYVTIKITESALSEYRAAAIEEIEAAIEGIANGDIRDIADKAKEEINVATTEEDVNSIKNKALADIEEASIYLPQTKADAIAEIEAAVNGVTDADILAIANKAKTDINNAIKVEKVITIKTQALAELAIAVKYYNSGKAAALGAMSEECTGCHAVEVTKGDKTITLYAPDKVKYIKVE